jgi:hypothetical protein
MVSTWPDVTTTPPKKEILEWFYDWAIPQTAWQTNFISYYIKVS